MAGLALLMLACASVAEAQVATIDERLAGSETVVVATAKSVTSEWRENEKGDRIIVSHVALDVEETLKGDASTTVWMEVEGGTIDGLTMRVSSLPFMTGGERGVYFLDRGRGAMHAPHLRGQGILFLDHDNVVRGSSLRLTEIRTRARAGK